MRKKKKKKKSRFWGVFIIAVHRALCWVWGGGRHRGIVELSEGG